MVLKTLQNDIVEKLRSNLTIVVIFTPVDAKQYHFMHKYKSTLNALSSMANRTASLPLAM